MAASKNLKPLRHSLTQYEEGAHLWAPLYSHFKGGIASMVPIAILFFTTQPFEQAMFAITAGGYTVVPAVVLTIAIAWAGMSKVLLHVLRFRNKLALHFAVYGAVGAVIVTGLALISTGVGPGLWSNLIADCETVATSGIADAECVVPVASGSGTLVVLLAPLVGLTGAIIGRWAMDREITWYRLVIREPLPDVFTFIDRKHDKDDFKRL